MDRIDTLSPSFFGGLLGYALTETGTGFWIGAAATWFALTALVILAAALSSEARARDRVSRKIIATEFAE
jgi:hypothetical protein